MHSQMRALGHLKKKKLRVDLLRRSYGKSSRARPTTSRHAGELTLVVRVRRLGHGALRAAVNQHHQRFRCVLVQEGRRKLAGAVPGPQVQVLLRQRRFLHWHL